MLTPKLMLKICAAVALLALSSCRTPKDLTYFQDINGGMYTAVSPVKELTIEPDDRVSILVHSKDPQLASLFNLSYNYQRAVGDLNFGSTTQIPTYTVNSFGDIDFPILGTLHIAGMTRTEVADYIKNELVSRNLIKDPTIIVDFYNRMVNVMGEVNNPGRIRMDHDRFTVLDALASAGDLTIMGKRENVIVLRNQGDKQVAYVINLTDAKSALTSPAYYLQQNDVIYVEPNNVRKRQTTSSGSTVFTPSFWISAASFATTVVLLIKNW